MSRRYWEKQVRRYSGRGTSRFGRGIIKAEFGAAASLWNSYIEPVDGWVLDLGAGSGNFYSDLGFPKKLVMLDIARSYPSLPGAIRVNADARSTPFKENTFAALVSLGLSEYIMDMQSALNIWRSLVYPGGKLLLTGRPVHSQIT